MRRSAAFLAAIWIATGMFVGGPAFAAAIPDFSDNPVGAAIALSVEPSAIGYCRDRDMARAVACAMEACVADGGESCTPVIWCHVAGVAGVMFGYKHEHGLSQLYGACGGFSREGIEAVLRAKCAADAQAADCAMVVFWEVDGAEFRVGE